MNELTISATQDILFTWLDEANSLTGERAQSLITLLGWRFDADVPGAFHTLLSDGSHPDGTIRVLPEGTCEVTFPLAPQLDTGNGQTWDMENFAEIISMELSDLLGSARRRRNAKGQTVKTWTSHDGDYRVRVTVREEHLDVVVRRPLRAQRFLGNYRSPALASTKMERMERVQNVVLVIAAGAILISLPLTVLAGTVVVALFPFALYSAGYPLALVIPVTLLLCVGYVYVMHTLVQRSRPVLRLLWPRVSR